MKILQINSVYGVGSTGKITRDIHLKLLESGIESVVLYGRGNTVNEKGVYRISSDSYAKVNNLWSRITGIRYGGCRCSTAKICRMILEEKPDVVHLQCVNEHFVNIYDLVTWLKKHRIPMVLTLHAEFMYTANCPHAFDCERWQTGCGQCPRVYQATKSLIFDRTHESYLKMKKAFDGFENGLEIVSVSPWLMERAKKSPILNGKQHRVICNGVDTTIFCPTNDDLIESKYCKAGRKLVFHATAFFSDAKGDPKGGAYVLELARKMEHENVLFLIAGKYEIRGDVPGNVVLLGEIKDQQNLAAYYSAAAVTLLTSKRETYSMVCAESLCCGTPVAGFEAGAPEQICLPGFSTFVRQGDMDALQTAILFWLDKPKDTSLAEMAQKKYGKDHMISAYMDSYRAVINKKNADVSRR